LTFWQALFKKNAVATKDRHNRSAEGKNKFSFYSSIDFLSSSLDERKKSITKLKHMRKIETLLSAIIISISLGQIPNNLSAKNFILSPFHFLIFDFFNFLLTR